MTENPLMRFNRRNFIYPMLGLVAVCMVFSVVIMRRSGQDRESLDNVYNHKIDDFLLKSVRHFKDDIEELQNEECGPLRQTFEGYFKNVQSESYEVEYMSDDNWAAFYRSIGNCDLYRDEQLIENLLNDISTMKIQDVRMIDSGTQAKMRIKFANGRRAFFKPLRFAREYEISPNHFYFSDFERSNAEIAAYHLDKVLGFRRAIPTVGRVVNISSEFLARASDAFRDTFFVSPAKNLCFTAKCDYYCDSNHPICGHPYMLEGSFQLYLPLESDFPRDELRNPWRRTYSRRDQVAEWQRDPMYCEKRVKFNKTIASGRHLLDLIDTHVFDFLMGNQDRHHFEYFAYFWPYTYYVHLDNGRGFGNSVLDDMDIMAPITQCCLMRKSTFLTLLRYYHGPLTLGQALEKSLSKDPVSPVLAKKHIEAVDRRLGIIIREMKKCLLNNHVNDVLITWQKEKDR